MRDMASGPVTRSSGPRTRRIHREVNGKSKKSSPDVLEDASSRGSELSSLSSPIRKGCSKRRPLDPAVSLTCLNADTDHMIVYQDTSVKKSKKDQLLLNGHCSNGPVATALMSEPASAESCELQHPCSETSSSVETTIIRTSQSPVSRVRRKKRVTSNQSRTETTTDNAESLQKLKDCIDSNDVESIFQLLDESDVKIVRPLIENLPIEYVPRLLDSIRKKICRKSVKTSNSIVWLEQLLDSRLTFLLSVSCDDPVFVLLLLVLISLTPFPSLFFVWLTQLPQANKTILPLAEALNTRIDVFDRVLKLKGRLNLLISQVCLCFLRLKSCSANGIIP